jgi:hypothetical protein
MEIALFWHFYGNLSPDIIFAVLIFESEKPRGLDGLQSLKKEGQRTCDLHL